MNKKSLEDYKRTLFTCSLKFYNEFKSLNALSVMINFISDIYVLMVIQKIQQNKINSQLETGLNMFIHSIKQLQPINSSELIISEAMYSCFIRACLPNTRFKNNSVSTPTIISTFRNWLIHVFYHNDIDSITSCINNNIISKCVLLSPKTLT